MQGKWLLTSALYILLTAPLVEAQLMPSQVITITTGNQGSVTRRQSSTEQSTQEVFNFSLSTDSQNTRNSSIPSSPRKVSQQQRTVKQHQQAQINVSSFSIERGTIDRRRSVTHTDTFNYIDSTFGQSFSIEY